MQGTNKSCQRERPCVLCVVSIAIIITVVTTLIIIIFIKSNNILLRVLPIG
jgi:disulfide bond formation protein DsbB